MLSTIPGSPPDKTHVAVLHKHTEEGQSHFNSHTHRHVKLAIPQSTTIRLITNDFSN